MNDSPWYRFAACGPYRVPLLEGMRQVDFGIAAARVFEQVESDNSTKKFGDLTSAIGLYVIGLSPSGSKVTWPYYVGQARKQTLEKRIFQKTDKEKVYGDILENSGYQRAGMIIYLFPLLTPTGKIAKIGSNKKIIDAAEYMLIGMAMRANSDLWNVKERASMDKFSIDGTPHSYRPRDTNAADRFRTMMAFS